MQIDLTRFTPSVLKGNSFWENIIAVAQQQMTLLQRRMATKEQRYKFDTIPYSPSDPIYTQYPSTTSYDDDMRAYLTELSDFCVSFGYPPNSELVTQDLTEWPLDRQVDLMQREAASIWFKIQFKGSLNYYNYIFKLYNLIGWNYILAWKTNSAFLQMLDWDATLPLLGTHTLGTKFMDFIPLKDITALVNSAFHWDSGFQFDSLVPWYWDEFADLNPTPHLAMEYVLGGCPTVLQYDPDSSSPTSPYLLVKRYMAYLRKAVDYGKKAAVVPHIGGQLNVVIPDSLYFDTVGDGNTIPELQLDAAVTKAYTASLIEGTLYYFDDPLSPYPNFDDALTWKMDNDYRVKVDKSIVDAFYQVQVGTGTKALYSSYHKSLYNDYLLYSSFEDDTPTTVHDYSTNAYVGTKHGTLTVAQGVSGKAYQYNGTDSYVSYPNVSKNNSNASMCLWFQPSAPLQTQNAVIVNWQDVLKVSTIPASSLLRVEVGFTVGSVAATVDVPFTPVAGVDNMIYTEWVQGTISSVNVYVNNTLASSIATTQPLNYVSNITLGASVAPASYYFGVLDEFKIYNKVLLSADRAYAYEHKVGEVLHLANPIYTSAPAYSEELYEDTLWRIRWMTQNIPAWSVNNQVVAIGNGASSTFSTFLPFAPILPYYTNIGFQNTYLTTTTQYELKDNGNGELIQTTLYSGSTALPVRSSGTINYTTGETHLVTYADYEYSNKNVYTGTASYTITSTLTNHDYVVPSHVLVTAYGGMTALDNGTGGFTGASVSAGTIDYNTGVMSVVWTSQVTIASVDYFDRLYAKPDNGTNITAEYKSNDDPWITEVGVLDNTGQVSLYATFPPVQFSNPLDHLRVNFAVKKSS